MTSEEKDVCPLCMEPMEADDLAFYPCDCRYQVCRFCWAKIINEENGLCPACRKEYNSEKPALYKPISEAEDAKLRSNRKRKDHLKKTKVNAEMLKLLPELRVVQPNLIFVVGLPAWICKDKEILKGPEYFGRYGKVFKVEINQNQTFGGPQGQPSFSAYITFCRAEDAMRSIKELDQGMLQGRPLRVSLGTTKYCSQFLRGTKCTKHECMYLHELGDPAASFTKEEMQAGKHTEYMNKLLSEYTPSATSSVPTLESSSSYAIPSTDDGSSNSKDASGQSNTRFRGRTDLGSERHSGCSPLKSTGRSGFPRPLTDPEPVPSAPSGDGRRTRHLRSDYTYSDLSIDDSSNEAVLSPCDIATKTNVWNRQLSADYLQSSSQKYGCGKPLSSSFSHVYTNGLGANVEKCSRLSKKPNEGRRIQSSEPGRAASHRKPVGAEAYSAPNGSTACVGSPSGGNWYPSSPSAETTNNLNLGEDPVDIGFDPFLESQQGLAELLAAEVGKLGLIGDDTSRNMYDVNGHTGVSETCSRDSRSQLLSTSTLDPNVSDFRPDQARRLDYPWMPDFMQCEAESQSDLNQHHSRFVFPKIYPPPGFEDSAHVLQQSIDSSVFSSSHPDSLLNYELSESNCSLNAHRTAGIGNPNLPCNNGLASNTAAYSFAQVPCNAGNKLDSSFDAFAQPRPAKSVDSQSHYRSPSSSFTNSTEGTHPFNTQDRIPQRSDSLASLFTAAFNTAAAMLSHRAAASSDKANPCASKSSPSNFDLSTFFNQLCRHSPLFSSLAAAHSASDWSTLLGNNASAAVNNSIATRQSGNLTDSFMDSTNPTALAAAAAAAAASLLLPSMQFPTRSDVLSSEDNASQINQANYHLPPGLSKPMSDLQQELPEVQVEKNAFSGSSTTAVGSSSEPTVSSTPLTWQLDDPAIVSSQLGPVDSSTDFSQLSSAWKGASRLSAATELIQQLWRSGSGISPIFAPQLAPGFNFCPTNQSSNNAVSQRTALRDSSLQSASHPQSTE